MNKILKVSMIVIGIIILLFLLLMIISFVNHKIKLKKEDNLFKTNGKLVEVNNHNINVYISGNSDSHTMLVFMSGAGTCSPTLDFKTLYSLFENNYQIAVVEKAGYGFSEISDIDRDIDTILFETREALNKAGIKDKKYIDDVHKNFDPFLSYKNMVKVEFTEKGVELYEKVLTNRPRLLNKKDGIYTFECDNKLALVYFAQFFSNVKILEPNELKERLKNELKKTIKIYENEEEKDV